MPTPLKGERPMTAAERSRRRWDRLQAQVSALRPIAEWVVEHASDAAIVAQARAALGDLPPQAAPPAVRAEAPKPAPKAVKEERPMVVKASPPAPPAHPAARANIPQTLARTTVQPRFRDAPKKR